MPDSAIPSQIEETGKTVEPPSVETSTATMPRSSRSQICGKTPPAPTTVAMWSSPPIPSDHLNLMVSPLQVVMPCVKAAECSAITQIPKLQTAPSSSTQPGLPAAEC